VKRSIASVLLCWSAALAYAQPHPSGANSDDDPRVKAPKAAASSTTQPRLSSARPSSNVARGSVEVEVVDVDRKPVTGTEVVLAILESGGARREQKQRTNAEGKATFVGLQVGKAHAYLVRLHYQGARFQSPPFQLPTDRGFAVVIHRLETTRDHNKIVVSGGQLSIWRGEERLELGQTVRLRNTSQMSYVFPDRGLTVQLPQSYQGFEPSPVMGDQRFNELAGRGFTITGSLTPGETMLAWKFDLPLPGSEVKFSLQMPWRIESYRVVADASSGMTLEVKRMPKATVFEEQGHKISVTAVELGSNDAPLRELKVEIAGILGDGPSRWIAAFLSLAIALSGLLVAAFTPRHRGVDPNAVDRRKEHLLDRAAKLKTARQEGRISERRYQRDVDTLVDELSDLLVKSKRAQFSQRRDES
jgi:hypothetical protein